MMFSEFQIRMLKEYSEKYGYAYVDNEYNLYHPNSIRKSTINGGEYRKAVWRDGSFIYGNIITEITYNEWLAIERERKIDELLNDI